MRYMNRRRIRRPRKGFEEQAFRDDDPMAGVANLFDLGLVFIVGLIMALFRRLPFAGPVQRNRLLYPGQAQPCEREMEIITKQGKRIEARKVSREMIRGRRAAPRRRLPPSGRLHGLCAGIPGVRGREAEKGLNLKHPTFNVEHQMKNRHNRSNQFNQPNRYLS